MLCLMLEKVRWRKGVKRGTGICGVGLQRSHTSSQKKAVSEVAKGKQLRAMVGKCTCKFLDALNTKTKVMHGQSLRSIITDSQRH